MPQGFTITTEACTQYYEDGRQINAEIQAEILEYIAEMETITGNKFGVTSLLTYARPTDFDRVITDTRIPSEWITKMGRLGITLNIAET